MKSVVVDPSGYDWEGDAPLRRPFASDRHLRDARRAASRGIRVPASAPELRGTYAGMIEKIPYLQDLGITAVELLPVFQFDRAGLSAGSGQLLGIFAGLVLRSACRLQFAARTRSARSTSSAISSRRCTAPGSK